MVDFPKYESYKNSEIPWLGGIPSHWDLRKNKFLLKEKKDVVGKKSTNFTLLSLTLQGVIARDMENPQGKFPAEFNTYKIVSSGDLIFCLFDIEETPRTVGHSTQNGMITGAYEVFDCESIVDSKYFYYYYLSLDFDKRLQSLYSGLRKVIKVDTFLGISSPVPPIEEQRRIVDFLDRKTAEIDQAIAQKQRLIELLKEQKTILIDRAVTQGLNPNVLVRDSDIEWIGKVPKHWKLVQNRYVFQEQNKRSANGNEIHLSMSQKFGLVPSHELESKTLQSESYEGAKLCLKTDLILNRLKAHLGVFSVAPCDGLVSPDYSVFRLRNQNMTSKYFEHLFKTAIYISEFNRKVKGIVMGFYRLYSDSFNEIPCLCPPVHEQVQIQNWILEKQQEFKIVENAIRTEIDRLLELKSVVISEAVTGKIKV